MARDAITGDAAREYPHGEIRRSVLPGGLRVVTENVANSRTFSFGCFVAVGSRQEAPRLHGASHFLEHVLFKGTTRRSAEEISAAVESVGGELNAYTAKEHTCFYGRVLDADAPLVVDVIADMLTSSRIRTADVAAERAVILDEIAMHTDDPQETAQELIARQLFGSGALGAPVIGSPESITALSRAQLVGHWRRHYRPDSMVISAAGHLDHDWLVDQVAALDLSGSQHSSHRVGASKIMAGDTDPVVVHRRRTEQASVILAFPAPGALDPRNYSLGLLSLGIGGGMASRLFVEVRERRGLAYGIETAETAYSDAGWWSVEWQCAPERVAEILTVVRDCLHQVAADGLSDIELARVKGQMRGQTMLGYEGPASRMSRLGAGELMGDRRTLPEIVGCYEAVTGDDVRAEAAAMFAQQPVLAVVGPRVRTQPLSAIIESWSDS